MELETNRQRSSLKTFVQFKAGFAQKQLAENLINLIEHVAGSASIRFISVGIFRSDGISSLH